MMVFAGSANPELTREIVGHLNMPLGKAIVDRFSDGEVMVELIDSVRGKDAFVVQPTCASSHGNQHRSVDQNLMELLILTDAIKRASAGRVTAVVPYFGYARQDRRPRSARVSISAKVVANMISEAGADRALTMDIHADQIQGFFNIPMDNIYASPVLLGDIWKHNYPNLMVVSPDVGGVVRARAIAKRLDDADLAIIDKRRPQANQAEVMNIIGDVRDRTCVLVDDIADTAGTLCSAASALKDRGGVAGRRLLHARGPVRRRGRQRRGVGARRAGGDQHHPARRARRRVPQDSPVERRRAARREHAPHERRGVDRLALHGLKDVRDTAPHHERHPY